MKVPTLNTTRTQAPRETRQYSSAQANPAAFGAGLAEPLIALGAQLQQREKQSERFGALRALNQFEQRQSQSLLERSRSASPDGRGFANMTQADFEKEEADFLSSLPPDLQEEFSVRTSQMKQGVLSKALDYQYKAGDAFFRQGIKDVYEEGRKALDPRLGGDASQLDVWRGKVSEAIDASDLSEVEKAELRRSTDIGLAGVGYRASVAQEARNGPALSGSIGDIVDSAADRYGIDRKTLRTLAWIESKGNPNAKNDDSGASGLFQFIPSTAKAYSLNNPFDPEENADRGARLTANNIEGLTRVLGRAPTIGEIYLAHQQGLGGATRLLRDPGARAADIVGTKAVTWNGGDANMTAGEFANKWISEAERVSGSSDMDARFANVPYEDKVAIKEDAMRDVAAEQVAETKQQAAVYDAKLNTLLTAVHDGTAGKVEIDAFRANNPGMDYNDVTKLDTAYKTYNETVGSAAYGIEKIQSGQTFDPASETDRKALNNLVGKTGLESIANADKSYMSQGVIPAVSIAQDIPTNVVGQLTGMVRSSNQTHWSYALDSLSQLQDTAPAAYAQRVSEAVQRDVEYWRSHRNLVPWDQLQKQMNPGTDAAERNIRLQSRKDAQTYLSTKVDGIPTLKTLVASMADELDAEVPTTPRVAQAVEADYRTFFTDAYELSGDVGQASTAAIEMMKRVWSPTQIGTGWLMKYPPEKSGYRAYNGSYDWINSEVRRENNLAPTAQFALISDDVTRQEFEQFKAGGRPPSYQIAVIDEFGVARLQPGRQWFQVPEETRIQDTVTFNAKQDLTQLRGRMEELSRTVEASRTLGVDPDPEDVQELDELREAYRERRGIIQNQPDTYEEDFDKRSINAGKAGASIGGMVVPDANN